MTTKLLLLLLLLMLKLSKYVYEMQPAFSKFSKIIDYSGHITGTSSTTLTPIHVQYFNHSTDLDSIN